MHKRKRAGNTITRKINSTKDTAAKADKNHYISNSYLEGFIPIDTEYFTASDTKFPFPSVWLRNLHSSDWGRGIFSLPDSFYQFVVIPPQPWQRRFDSHPIDSRRSLVRLHSFVSPVQVILIQYLT